NTVCIPPAALSLLQCKPYGILMIHIMTTDKVTCPHLIHQLERRQGGCPKTGCGDVSNRKSCDTEDWSNG
ncbi:hypothetical protein F2P79_010025, partial [Pimephales promelas]